MNFLNILTSLTPDITLQYFAALTLFAAFIWVYLYIRAIGKMKRKYQKEVDEHIWEKYLHK